MARQKVQRKEVWMDADSWNKPTALRSHNYCNFSFHYSFDSLSANTLAIHMPVSVRGFYLK